MTAICVTPRRCHRAPGPSGSLTCPAFDLVPLAVRLPANGTSAALLWASHCNKIEVGGCTDCVLAATTSAAAWAIHEREHTNAKEPIVTELAEIEVEAEESEENAPVYACRVAEIWGLGLS